MLMFCGLLVPGCLACVAADDDDDANEDAVAASGMTRAVAAFAVLAAALDAFAPMIALDVRCRRCSGR